MCQTCTPPQPHGRFWEWIRTNPTGTSTWGWSRGLCWGLRDIGEKETDDPHLISSLLTRLEPLYNVQAHISILATSFEFLFSIGVWNVLQTFISYLEGTWGNLSSGEDFFLSRGSWPPLKFWKKGLICLAKSYFWAQCTIYTRQSCTLHRTVIMMLCIEMSAPAR